MQSQSGEVALAGSATLIERRGVVWSSSQRLAGRRQVGKAKVRCRILIKSGDPLVGGRRRRFTGPVGHWRLRIRCWPTSCYR